MAQFCCTEKGKRKLSYQGYTYVREKDSGAITYWQCEKKKICKTRVHSSINIQPGDTVKLQFHHSHGPKATRKEVLQAIEKTKGHVY